jgi:hypothetical protein
MFVQSYQTNMHIFPDWPTNQSAAFGNLNACGGFLVSGAITLGTANYVQIQSTAGQMLKLANPVAGRTSMCFEHHRRQRHCRAQFSIIKPRWGKC